MPFLSTSRPSWCDLNFEPAPGQERIDRAGVLVELESIRDHCLAVDDALGEQRERPLEAVEYGHRADDLDLVVVDLEGREGGGRVRFRHAEHQERPASSDPSQSVFYGGYHTGCVDD